MSAAEAIAVRAVDAAMARLVDRLGAALPGVAVVRVADGVQLSAPGLSRRLIDEPALRWPAGVLR